MNMFDEARAMEGTLLLCKITQRELAKRMGVSQSYIANKLRLLSFPEDMRKRIIEGGVSERHARAILPIGDENKMREMIERVITRSLTVRECEALVEIYKTESTAKHMAGVGRGDAVDAFCRAMREGVQMLSLCGVDARARTSISDGKMYINVCISTSEEAG